MPSKELQIVKAQRLGTDIARIVTNPTLYGNPSGPNNSSGTIRTDAEWQFYCAMIGALGPDGKGLALKALNQYRELTRYVPYDDVTRQFTQTLPELVRDDLGFMEQKVPQISFGNKTQVKRYHNNPYSYVKYVRAGYIKSAAKSAYSRIEKEIEDAVAKIKGLYNSGKGVFKSKRAHGQGSLEQMLAPA